MAARELLTLTASRTGVFVMPIEILALIQCQHDPSSFAVPIQMEPERLNNESNRDHDVSILNVNRPTTWERLIITEILRKKVASINEGYKRVVDMDLE